MTVLTRIREAAQAFLDPIEGSFDYESGISNSEADQGMIAAMLHLGVLTQAEADEAQAQIKVEHAEQVKKWAAESKARYDAMTPEERKLHDEIEESASLSREILQYSILESVFSMGLKT